MKTIKQNISFLIFVFSFIILVSIIRQWFSPQLYWQFWLGAAIGALLPDVDHLIYAFFLKPDFILPKEFIQLARQKGITQATISVSSGEQVRPDLVFHTMIFQVMFLIFSFLVITSSSSFLGRGIVLGFLLHLAYDQLKDLVRFGSLNSWLGHIKLNLDKEKSTLVWLLNFSVIIILSFL